MTYDEFLARNEVEQLKYIAAEDERMVKAMKLWRKYDQSMKEIGLHPLIGFDLEQRQAQLKRMRREAPTSHGSDTPGNRAIFKMMFEG